MKVLVLIAMLLSGCGGGGSSAAPAPVAGWYYVGDECAGLWVCKLGPLPAEDCEQIRTAGYEPPDLRLVLADAPLSAVLDPVTGAMPAGTSVYALWAYEPWPRDFVPAPLQRSEAGMVGCVWVPSTAPVLVRRLTCEWYDAATGGARIGVW